MKSCADGAAVARCSIDFLSDSISPVVAPNSIHCGICLFGLGTASEKRKIRSSPVLAEIQAWAVFNPFDSDLPGDNFG